MIPSIIVTAASYTIYVPSFTAYKKVLCMSSFRCVSSQLKQCDMGRSPCCAKVGLNRGAWTAVEDQILTAYIGAHGEGKWRNLPKKAGLKRCGKSCRLRWLNYLKPGIKRGNISPDEDELIVKLHNLLGNRWSLIAGRLPGRTDNEIKNYWNSTLSKRCRAHPSSEPSRTSLAKRSTVKNSNAENSSSEANLNLSPVPAAIRTKAHRFTKRFVQCTLPPRDQESFIKSTPQNTLLEPLISEPHQESHNGGEVHNLQITADHSNNISLDPLELSSHYFEARDNGAKKGEECSLKISSIDFPESDDGEKFECSTNFTEDGDSSLSYDHLTLEYMVDDLFQDDNMINLSSLACWLDDEDWPLEENKTTCQKLN